MALTGFHLEEEQEGKKKIIPTGNVEIDNKMGGGIPVGSLMLIEGDSHAGKSVLSQQLIWGSLNDGFRVTLFSTENTVKSLVKQMQSLSIDILDFLLLGRFRIYPMRVARADSHLLQDLLRAIVQEREKGAEVIFVDALTPAIVVTPETEVLGYFEDCKRLCSEDLTIINVVHSHAVSKDFLVRLTSLCDAHLKLRTEEVGERLIKMMEVAKVRGATKTTGNIVSFEIEPGWGMRIIPLSKARG